MEPVHFQGLHCYHDCVISVANHFGIDYAQAFATLWSETDFRYDPYRNAYLTKRMITNLEALGAQIKNLPFSSHEELAENVSRVCDGEYMIVGMDAFYIPWNELYQTLHGPHYFIAQPARDEAFFCVDPTYGKKNEQITRGELVAHTFDFIHVREVAASPPQTEITHEAREILRTHPHTRRVLRARVKSCVNGVREEIILLAKYIDAMTDNRYLYRFFLRSHMPSDSEAHAFMGSDFFAGWKTVKNGLYKAAVVKNNEAVVRDVCGYLDRLLDEEMKIAGKITG